MALRPSLFRSEQTFSLDASKWCVQVKTPPRNFVKDQVIRYFFSASVVRTVHGSSANALSFFCLRGEIAFLASVQIKVVKTNKTFGRP